MAGQSKSSVLAYLYLWLCLCLCKTFADSIPEIIVNDWTQCDVSENSFLTLWNLSIKECLLECDKRKRCKALNFMRGVKKCQLLKTDLHNETDVDSGLCMHVKMVDNTAIHSVSSQCASCPAIFVDDLSYGSCSHEECELFPVAHGAVVGNMNIVGSAVMTIPEPGYTLGEQSPRSVCLSNGTWDNTPVPKRVDCGQPPTLPNALLTNGDTVYETTRYYKCDTGYDFTPSTANSSITCGAGEEWSQPEVFECSDPCYTEWQSSVQGTGIRYRACLCKKNYEDATAYCLSLDSKSHLAYVKTAQEYHDVKQYLKVNFDTNSLRSWWIGISMGSPGWVYTGTETPITFTSWHPGQGSGDTGQCVEFTFVYNNWNDALCSKGKYPLCEIREEP